MPDSFEVYVDFSNICISDSSDDSYVSAGEDPMEAPVFESPLQDAVAFSGADIILKCIIAGTPIPEGNHSTKYYNRIKIPYRSVSLITFNNCFFRSDLDERQLSRFQRRLELCGESGRWAPQSAHQIGSNEQRWKILRNGGEPGRQRIQHRFTHS